MSPLPEVRGGGISSDLEFSEPNFGFGRSPFHGSREEEDEWEVAYVRGRSRVVLLQVEGCWVWAGERVPVRVNHRHFGRKF